MSRLFAAGYDVFMRATEQACLSEWRRALLAPLTGRVLEVGVGTGASLAHYPRGLERLVLTDADPHMLARARRRMQQSPPTSIEPEIVVAHAESLPFADRSFDAVVVMLLLCSAEDPARVLAEVRRVLAPGAKLVFLEHVAADGGARRVWQERLEPLWRHLAHNCHLTRDTARTIERAGFAFEHLEHASMRKALPILRPTIRGVAVAN